MGRKDGGPIGGASEFVVTAFVPRQLSVGEMDHLGVRPVNQVFSAVAGSSAQPQSPDDLDAIECGSTFGLRQFQSISPGLSVPVAQRGVHGGLLATLNTQK